MSVEGTARRCWKWMHQKVGKAALDCDQFSGLAELLKRRSVLGHLQIWCHADLFEILAICSKLEKLAPFCCHFFSAKKRALWANLTPPWTATLEDGCGDSGPLVNSCRFWSCQWRDPENCNQA